MPSINFSAEMMENYVPAELISPQSKFEALQTNNGHSLLFSISTDSVFYLIEETSGQTAAGWVKNDLSSAQIKKDFSSKPSLCKTFDVAQSVEDDTFGMAMVISTDTGDHLYLSLGNSNTETSWVENIKWTSFEYDGDTTINQLEIVNVFFCETIYQVQYIAVDIVRNPNANEKVISRYYIDPTKKSAGGQCWNSHELPADFDVDNYQSKVGRLINDTVDGLYTAGHISGTAQLIYRPIVNIWGGGPPAVTRLSLPNNVIPSAITTTRNSDKSTDLFVVSGKKLYYFSSTNQKDGAVGVSIMANSVFAGTTKLSAMNHNGVITLWGKNASDQVYYTSCPQSKVSKSSAWTLPLPILSEIEKMSPYVNKADGGNTIFASGGGKLQKVFQDTASSSKLWKASSITLPAPPMSESISFNSYTTTIQVLDDQNLPLKNTNLSLSASNRCSVYINGIYYTIGKTPITIKSNSLGSVTIVESTNTLTGTVFTVSMNSGDPVVINPMDSPFQKIASLGDSKGDTTALKNAEIDEGNGQTTKLVTGSNSDLQQLSLGLSNLAKSYSSVNNASSIALEIPNHPLAQSQLSGNNSVLVAAGDLFKWLESGVEAVIEVVEDTVSATWHFIANIAGKVYTAVLDSVHAVIGAVEWLFNAIKTAIEDLIKFLQFLFEWDDIKRTKAVLHNLIKVYLNAQVDGMKTMQTNFDHMIEDVESSINEWAVITDWSPLGAPASKSASGSSSNPTSGQSSASQHFSHHFQNHSENITITGSSPSPDLLESLINNLMNALKSEADVLDAGIQQLADLASDFSSLTVEEVIKRLAAILIDGVLSSTQVVVDALFNILYDVAKTSLEILDTKIHIPVISDILNTLGIPDISFLDLFCWIPSVAYTVIYKIAENEAPFPDDNNTQFLIDATSLDELQQAFSNGVTLKGSQKGNKFSAAEIISIPSSVQDTVFITGMSVAGFCTLMSDFISTFEAAAETGDNPWGIPSAVLGIIGAGSAGIANFLVPKAPIKNNAVSGISVATTGFVILSKIVFSGPLQDKFEASEGVMNKLAVDDGRATGAIVDTILIIPALACTGWHFYELSQTAANAERSISIVNEVSNLTSYISRISYALAVNDEDSETKAAEIGVMAIANVATAGLQTAEALIN